MLLTELDEDGVEGSIVEGVADVRVGEGALGRGGDVVLLARALRVRLDALHERRVVRGRAALDVEVDTARKKNKARSQQA